MNEDDVLAILREKLTVDVDFKKGYTYWDDPRFVVRLLWDGQELSESSVSVPEWEEKRSEY